VLPAFIAVLLLVLTVLLTLFEWDAQAIIHNPAGRKASAYLRRSDSETATIQHRSKPIRPRYQTPNREKLGLSGLAPFPAGVQVWIISDPS
jgi:hypothetical protein